jgi:hypothetical protein
MGQQQEQEPATSDSASLAHGGTRWYAFDVRTSNISCQVRGVH